MDIHEPCHFKTQVKHLQSYYRNDCIWFWTDSTSELDSAPLKGHIHWKSHKMQHETAYPLSTSRLLGLTVVLLCCFLDSCWTPVETSYCNAKQALFDPVTSTFHLWPWSMNLTQILFHLTSMPEFKSVCPSIWLGKWDGNTDTLTDTQTMPKLLHHLLTRG